MVKISAKYVNVSANLLGYAAADDAAGKAACSGGHRIMTTGRCNSMLGM
jgi:hypothetical protein